MSKNLNPKLSKNNLLNVIYVILLTIVGTIIGNVISDAISGQGRFEDMSNSQVGIFILQIIILIGIGILFILTWQLFLEFLKSLWRFVKLIFNWCLLNWHITIGGMILIGIAIVTYFLTQSFLYVAILMGIVLSFFLLTKPVKQIDQKQERESPYQTIPLPIGLVANSNIKEKYSEPPNGLTRLNGVEFDIGELIFDTSKERIIDSDGFKRTKLIFVTTIKNVKSVHLLINAGGGWKKEPQSKVELDWFKIGRVKFVFRDGTTQETEIRLGDNVREWAIGNFPGKLVDRVSDPSCQVAWKGQTTEGKYAVIDHLEIPIQDMNKSKQLKSIIFIRDIHSKAKPAEGGNLHYMIHAITFEIAPPNN